MRILISIGHPAHVHFFKNLIWELQKQGHFVLVTSREKDVATNLLNKYGISHTPLTHQFKNNVGKYTEFIEHSYKLYKLINKNNIELTMSISGKLSVWASKLAGVKSYVFDDTEHDKFAHKYCLPFANKIFTPDCYLLDLGPKQVRYQGYHELAYLHPNRFTPNPDVLKEIGLTEHDKFFIVRFVSWEATHDVGQKGLSIEDKRKLIETLKLQGKIIISSEKELPAEFEGYRMPICPTKMHDLLYYATIYIGESPTIATESAILGTPSILVNDWAVNAGNMIELEKKFKLMFSYKNYRMSENILNSFFENIEQIKKIWKEKSIELINNKIDVTDYLINLIKLYEK